MQNMSQNGWYQLLVAKAIATFNYCFSSFFSTVTSFLSDWPSVSSHTPPQVTDHRGAINTGAEEAGRITSASHSNPISPLSKKEAARESITMSGIIHKIEETLHMGGDHKKEEEHKKAEAHKKAEEHHKKDGEHKEGIVEKIKDKITGEHGDKSGEHKDDKDHKEKKDKKKKKEKKHGEGHHDGHSSSSSDSD